MCDLNLNEDRIMAIRDEGELNNFVEAGMFYHARERPWCAFLKRLPEEYRNELLGKLGILKTEIYVQMV